MANATNPDRFAPQGSRLFAQQQVTLAAGARGRLAPDILLDHERAEILYGVLVDGVLTEADIVLDEQGVAITPDDGIPLSTFADTTPPEVQLRRAGIRLFPRIKFGPTVVNNGAGAQTFTVIWVLEKRP